MKLRDLERYLRDHDRDFWRECGNHAMWWKSKTAQDGCGAAPT